MASRKTSKAGQKWSKQVEAAGSKAEFAKKLIPKAVQKASRRSFSLLLTKNAKSKAKGKAKNKPHDKTGTAAKAASTKDKAASGGAPAKPWTGAMQWSVIKDHPLLKKVVRVVGASSCPEHIGKQGTVELVQICECAATGAQHSQVSLSIGKAKMCHVDLRDVQEEDPDVCTAAIVPFRQNFTGFAKDLSAVRIALSQGPEAENLEPASDGKFLESGTVAAGQM